MPGGATPATLLYRASSAMSSCSLLGSIVTHASSNGFHSRTKVVGGSKPRVVKRHADLPSVRTCTGW